MQNNVIRGWEDDLGAWFKVLAALAGGPESRSSSPRASWAWSVKKPRYKGTDIGRVWPLSSRDPVSLLIAGLTGTRQHAQLLKWELGL